MPPLLLPPALQVDINMQCVQRSAEAGRYQQGS
jgi:hypothetical protein